MFSYYYEIRLQVKNEAITWQSITSPLRAQGVLDADSISHELSPDSIIFDHIRTTKGNSIIGVATIVCMWIPLLLTFFMDIQIVFTLVQVTFIILLNTVHLI